MSAAPVGAVPENGDVLAADTVQDAWDQTSSNSTNSEGLGADAQVAEQKRFATAQAKLAIAGFQLERMADGSFVVARWTMTRSLADMAAVEAFEEQVGAR